MAQDATVRWSSPEVILVATDLLEGYSLTLHAIYQAKLSKAKVLLVHVIPPSNMGAGADFGLPFVLPSPTERIVKEKLDEMVKEFQREGILCEPIILKGFPAQQIPLLVKSRSVDRVIVATRGATGVARLVQGSVAEELIAALNVPLCVVGRRAHPGAACGTPLGRILLATSFHPGSSQLAVFASTLAEVNHSHLTLLHVLETPSVSEQERELTRMVARQRLAGMVPKEARQMQRPDFLVSEGDPATIILDEVASRKEELVILGSPRPSLASWVRGTSVVHRVVVEAHCPVIAFRPTVTLVSESLFEPVDVEVELGLY